MTTAVLGIDVGGTRIKACLATADGEVLRDWVIPTDAHRGPDAVVNGIIETAVQLASESPELAGIGLAVPGRVNEDDGIALHSSNIGWRDVPLRDRVAAATGLPVTLAHDVRAGSLAEDRWGAASEHPTSLFVPIGTGVAISFVQGGRALAGADWLAGDVGHLQLAREVAPCGCGRPRCLETVSSARAIGHRYSVASGADATAEQVARLVDRGDALAMSVWTDAIEALAVALTMVATVTDPHVIVVGGGLSESGDTLMKPLGDALEPRLAQKLARARFGGRAGMIGAAAVAWKALV